MRLSLVTHDNKDKVNYSRTVKNETLRRFYKHQTWAEVCVVGRWASLLRNAVNYESGIVYSMLAPDYSVAGVFCVFLVGHATFRSSRNLKKKLFFVCLKLCRNKLARLSEEKYLTLPENNCKE